jgi:disulfide bond formation protein DsbB
MHCRLPTFALASLITLVGIGAIGTALIFQHAFGYAPCALCLWERWPYYLGVPVAALLVALNGFSSRRILLLGFVLLILLFAINTGLGGYHAGVEWGFWPGPTSCSSGGGELASGNLLGAMQNSHIVPCDRASWRFLGLSFAGWNVVVSFCLLLMAACGGLRVAREGSSHGSSSVSQ